MAANAHGGLALVAMCALAAPLSAQFIVPSSYTATAGQGTLQGGSYDYFDDTGSQLTDGVFGGNIWSADLGSGNAREWVAWITVEPTLTFNFSTSVSISAVTLGLSHGVSGGVYIPTSVTIGSETFALTGSEFGDNLRQDLTFTLATPFVGNQLTIGLSDGDPGRWIFLDEVRFTAVPEPTAGWLVLPVGLAALWLRRQRNQDSA